MAQIVDLQDSKGGDTADDSTDLEGVLAQLPQQDAYIAIQRYNAEGQRAYLGRMVPDGFSLEAVREKWGGGRYLIEFYAADAEGARRKRKASRTVFIEGDSAPRRDAPATSTPAPAAYDPREMFREFQTALREERQVMLEAIKSIRSEPQAKSDIVELVTAVKALHEMTAPPRAPALQAAPAPAVVDSIGSIQTIIAMAKDLAGLPSGEDKVGPLDLLAKTVDKLVPVLAAATQRPAPGTAPAIAPQAQTQPEPGAQQPVNNPFNPAGHYVRQLLDHAQAGTPPEQLVDTVLDNTPPAMLDQVLADPVGVLGRYDARAPQFAAWINRLAQLIQEAENETDSAANEPA